VITDPAVATGQALRATTERLAALDLGDVFDQLPDGFAACDGSTDADGSTMSVSPASFPEIGEHTFATQIDIGGETTFPASVLYVLAGKGDSVVFTGYVTVGAGGADTQLVEDVTRTMVDRL